jgi:hypothetical protein
MLENRQWVVADRWRKIPMSLNDRQSKREIGLITIIPPGPLFSLDWNLLRW